MGQQWASKGALDSHEAKGQGYAGAFADSVVVQ